MNKIPTKIQKYNKQCFCLKNTFYKHYVQLCAFKYNYVGGFAPFKMYFSIWGKNRENDNPIIIWKGRTFFETNAKMKKISRFHPKIK